jgi:DNA-binding CsgD family transcriptional regulator
MEAICGATRTTGAALLQSDIRTPDVPQTPSVVEFFKNYFENDHHLADIRAIRGVPLLLSGRSVIRDQDIFLQQTEMGRDPMYAALERHGFRWWSAISFRSGSALWALSLQRTIQEGMFEDYEVDILASLSQTLTEVATLSKAVGRQVVLGSLNAFNLITEPALALTPKGIVTDVNEEANALFSEDLRIHNKRLFMRDTKAMVALDQLLTEIGESAIRLRTSAGKGNVVIVRRETKRPIMLTVMPVHGAARSPFSDAHFIVTFRDLEKIRPAPAKVVSEMFSLTPAEGRIAMMIAAGRSPEEIAEGLYLSRETVRTQIKAVFQKTRTHRQNELAALIARIG